MAAIRAGLSSTLNDNWCVSKTKGEGYFMLCLVVKVGVLVFVYWV